jgi:hypothetical protein
VLASVFFHKTSEQPPFKKEGSSWDLHKASTSQCLAKYRLRWWQEGGGVTHPTLFSFQLVLPPLWNRVLPAICRRPVAKFETHNETRSGSTTMQIVTIATKQNRFYVFFCFLFYSPTFLTAPSAAHTLPSPAFSMVIQQSKTAFYLCSLFLRRQLLNCVRLDFQEPEPTNIE